MKPFDINLAKQGHPVCTRDGRPARVICWDCKSSIGEDKTPIVALIQLSDGGEYPYCYYKNGLFTDRHTDKRDLMMASVKHEGWVLDKECVGLSKTGLCRWFERNACGYRKIIIKL